jgi:uncharacterized protein (TIGR00290 family)
MPARPDKCRTLLSWSSGKDSAWALYRLQQSTKHELAGLITTFNHAADRVAMHAVRRTLVRQQAAAAELPLIEVDLPWPCSNEDYEASLCAELIRQRDDHGITHIAFGDLFLGDVRAYRERQVASLGLQPLFPLWGAQTAVLAREMLAEGLGAYLTCVDPKQISPVLAGRPFDASLLDNLPDSADPCGENGEFHTFVWQGPMFAQSLSVVPGEIVERDGFVFADIASC